MTCIVANKLGINCGCPAQIPGGAVDKCTNPKLRDKKLVEKNPLDFVTKIFGDNPTGDQKEVLDRVFKLKRTLNAFDSQLKSLEHQRNEVTAKIDGLRAEISAIVMKHNINIDEPPYVRGCTCNSKSNGLDLDVIEVDNHSIIEKAIHVNPEIEKQVYPVGSILEYNGVFLEVVETPFVCDGCFLT